MKRLYRFAVPKDSQPEQLRDEAADAVEKTAHEVEFVKSSILFVPILAVFWVAANLLVQARGDIGLAVTIASQIWLASFALVAAANVLSATMIGLVAIVPIVASDRAYDAKIRNGLRACYIPLCFVLFMVVPLWLALGCLAASYMYWRVDASTKRRATAVSVEQWLARRSPTDVALKTLWDEGRHKQAEVGIQAYATSPDFKAFSEKALARQRAINTAAKKNVYNALFAVLVGLVAAEGLQLFITPVQFGHPEQVTLSDGQTITGYVLAAWGTTDFIMNPKVGLYRFTPETQIVSRSFCSSPESWVSFGLLNSNGPLQGVECPGFRY